MRTMVLTALLATIGVSGHASEADLIGTYAARDKTGLREVLKIEREGSAYVLHDKKRDGTWRKAKEPLVPVTKEQFGKLLKASAEVPPFDGLASKGVAVFKVPRGWGQGKFKTDSGYFMVFAFGPVELQKQ
jgi:hypothetical protein